MGLNEGEQFPDLNTQTHQGQAFSLSGYRGQKNVVLYFYPKDLTPGCTREAIDFDRKLEQFGEYDTVVVGVSVDPKSDHESFSAACGLHFPLLSDTDRTLSRQLGILNEKGTYAKRTTFVIDKTGKVRKIFHVTQVDGHVDQVLEAVSSLKP